MDIDLPGARDLFSHMYETLHHVKGKRVALTRGIHQALSDFRWLVADPSKLSIIMYELVPLKPTLDSYQDASWYMCGGAVIPGPIT